MFVEQSQCTLISTEDLRGKVRDSTELFGKRFFCGLISVWENLLCLSGFLLQCLSCFSCLYHFYINSKLGESLVGGVVCGIIFFQERMERLSEGMVFVLVFCIAFLILFGKILMTKAKIDC